MENAAYITMDQDGHIALFWGNGTEDIRELILRGPRPQDSREVITIVEELKQWADDHGYQVIVPPYDLTFTDIPLTPTAHDEQQLEPGDFDELLDDLFLAEDDVY